MDKKNASSTKETKSQKARFLPAHELEQLIPLVTWAGVGRMASDLAHDINNPVGIIQAKTHLLLRRCSQSTEHQDIERIHRDLHVILDQCQQLHHLTEHLSMLGRWELHQQIPLSLEEPIHNATSLLDSKMRRHGIRLVLTDIEQLPAVLGNSASLEHAFLQLLVNAIESMSSGGQLRITAALEDTAQADQRRCVNLTIADTGDGMDEALAARAFEPFFSTKEQNGRGLGLNLVQQIIAAHNASISLISEEGKGTTAQLTFPLYHGG